MIPKTIRTDERVFQVYDVEGNIPYLCNLDHFRIEKTNELLTTNGYSIAMVKHLWNNSFKKISKKYIKEMINTK